MRYSGAPLYPANPDCDCSRHWEYFASVTCISSEGHGKASARVDDSRELPTCSDPFRVLEEAFEGKLVLIARNEVVSQIECGKRARGAKVDGIHGVGNTRCLVNRLAEGVSNQEAQALAGVPKQAGLALGSTVVQLTPNAHRPRSPAWAKQLYGIGSDHVDGSDCQPVVERGSLSGILGLAARRPAQRDPAGDRALKPLGTPR